MTKPSILLYTAHHCPFAHRVQTVLRELALPFDTALVDINVPRTAEYLAVNPSGMVPALVYDGKILTESRLICQFLVETHPSHLQPARMDSHEAFHRYRINLFVETYASKVHCYFDSAVFSPNVKRKMEMANQYIDSVVQHVEPLLADADPFFGGRTHLTLAEVCTSGFRHRLCAN